jgi:hypothetical protein
MRMSHIVWPDPYGPTPDEHVEVIEAMTNTTYIFPPELFDQKVAEKALKHLPMFVVVRCTAEVAAGWVSRASAECRR